MPKYRYGDSLPENIAIIERMARYELLQYIEGLQGTDHLRFDATDDEIREEAERQCRIDWRR